mgnify:FL=1|jgi:hypothetical protein|tara:strand:+ start:101 stop:556 length:456 start_codon:yes stop_codon:yes gene_type:complete
MIKFQYDLEKIKKELETLPDYNKQLYLQGYSKDMNPEEGTDKGYDIDSNEHTYTVPLFDIPYINSIMEEHKLTRTRLMRMKPKSCYLWHNDLTQRLHIPIVTNEHCFLLLDSDRIHIPATGEAYVMNTTKKHTALNCSKENRIHIVGGLPY